MREEMAARSVAAPSWWQGAPGDGSRRMALAAVLTALSGFVDAVGYAALGHLYLSFMSGNSTHLGVSLAGANWADAAPALAIIAAFVGGAWAGTLVADRKGPKSRGAILGCEFGIFLAATAIALGGGLVLALVPVAFAMGMHNTLHQVIAGADVGRGFISGNLFGLGRALARLRRDRAASATAVQNALAWLAFIAGVVVGAIAITALRLPAALGLAAVMIGALLLAVRLGRA